MPQKLDLAKPDAAPATYTLLIDTQPEHGAADGLRPRRGAAAARSPAARRQRHRRAVHEDARHDYRVRRTIRDTIVGRRRRESRRGGGTAILTALVTAVGDSSARSTGRHIIVLITDGYDEHSAIDFERALDAVKAAKAHGLRDWRRRHRRHLARRARTC